MESNSPNPSALEHALDALRFQIDEGVDEWILNAPQSRFEEARAAREKKTSAPLAGPEHKSAAIAATAPLGAPVSSAPELVDFSSLESEEAIIEALHLRVSASLREQLHDPLPDLGAADADVVVIADPPFREALEKGDLLGDASTRLLRKSLQAIDVDIDASTGKEPRARLRILPVSPWRLPQDRKFADHEAKIFRDALEARLQLSSHRVVLLAGSNLANVAENIKDDRLFGLPVIELVSPRAMLREPLLKRVHWQRLLMFHQNLDRYLSM